MQIINDLTRHVLETMEQAEQYTGHSHIFGIRHNCKPENKRQNRRPSKNSILKKTEKGIIMALEKVASNLERKFRCNSE